MTPTRTLGPMLSVLLVKQHTPQNPWPDAGLSTTDFQPRSKKP
jgi:hypothetical protein